MFDADQGAFVSRRFGEVISYLIGGGIRIICHTFVFVTFAGGLDYVPF